MRIWSNFQRIETLFREKKTFKNFKINSFILDITYKDFQKYLFNFSHKLGGIVVPNDGKCHMSNNRYTHWQILDYPSMHHIAEKVRENKFNIVFSVDESVKKVYQTLIDTIGSNAHSAELKADDSTIVELIDSVYKKIRSTVNLKAEKIPDNIYVEFYSNCSNKLYKKTAECEFEKKPIIGFDAKISMKSCPKDKSKWNQILKIGFENYFSFQILRIYWVFLKGLANTDENVEIDLKMLCECDCEIPGNSFSNSVNCSNAGTFACGICSKCNGKRFGNKCDCDPEKPINASDTESHCKEKGIFWLNISKNSSIDKNISKMYNWFYLNII